MTTKALSTSFEDFDGSITVESKQRRVTKSGSADIYKIVLDEVHKSTSDSLTLEQLDEFLAERIADYDDQMAEAYKWAAERFYEGEESLRAIRLRRGLSQTDLAKLVHTSQAQIAKIESGKAEPKVTTVARLAEALDMPSKELFEVILAGMAE